MVEKTTENLIGEHRLWGHVEWVGVFQGKVLLLEWLAGETALWWEEQKETEAEHSGAWHGVK